jgi:hypothetical protein
MTVVTTLVIDGDECKSPGGARCECACLNACVCLDWFVDGGLRSAAQVSVGADVGCTAGAEAVGGGTANDSIAARASLARPTVAESHACMHPHSHVLEVVTV